MVKVVRFLRTQSTHSQLKAGEHNGKREVTTPTKLNTHQLDVYCTAHNMQGSGTTGATCNRAMANLSKIGQRR